MKIEIAKHERMSESGGSLLRLMQNNDTARLDLLVRESVQNCLDAGDGSRKPVKVNFRVGQFQTKRVAPFFEGVEDNLLKKYPGNHNYIAIEDKNTVGLTGPIRYDDIKDDVFGNCLKLIYEISKPQEQSGSGGSWGLGKTVYFRIGIGLVIYYSRIFNETTGKYESRMAATLVEDETLKDSLLKKNRGSLNRGIAWWGMEDPKSRSKQHTIPLINQKETGRILKSFGIEEYSDEETGTIIIIPYTDNERLLAETIPDDEEADYKVPYWSKKNIEEYLKISIQRWYCPRINNKSYRGQYLEVSINEEKLKNSDMAPVFRLIQRLYNARPDDDDKDYNDTQIFSKIIEIRNAFRKTATAGWINYIKVTSKDMKMEAPNNLPNPYYYINKMEFDSMNNDPIILFARKPGMVVSYETTGDWTDSIPKTSPGEYIIGMFVANSLNELSIDGSSFEEYIRNSEKADHMAWNDWSVSGKNPQIVAKIKKNVRKKIKDDFAAITASEGEKKNYGLGKMLADSLLPPTDFVYWDDARGGSGGEGGTGGSGKKGNNGGETPPSNTTSHIVIRQIGGIEFDGDVIEIPIQILFGIRHKAVVEICIDSESGNIKANDWEKEMGAFPIELNGFRLKKVFRGKAKQQEKLLDADIKLDKEAELNGVKIAFKVSDAYSVKNQIEIEVPEANQYAIEGNLCYKADNVQGSLRLSREE